MKEFVLFNVYKVNKEDIAMWEEQLNILEESGYDEDLVNEDHIHDLIFLFHGEIVYGDTITKDDMQELINSGAVWIDIVPITFCASEEVSVHGNVVITDELDFIKEVVSYANKEMETEHLFASDDFAEIITVWEFTDINDDLYLKPIGIMDKENVILI